MQEALSSNKNHDEQLSDGMLSLQKSLEGKSVISSAVSAASVQRSLKQSKLSNQQASVRSSVQQPATTSMFQALRDQYLDAIDDSSVSSASVAQSKKYTTSSNSIQNSDSWKTVSNKSDKQQVSDSSEATVSVELDYHTQSQNIDEAKINIQNFQKIEEEESSVASAA